MAKLFSRDRRMTITVGTLWSDIGMGVAKKDKTLPLRLAINRHLDPGYEVFPVRVGPPSNRLYYEMVHQRKWRHFTAEVPVTRKMQQWMDRLEKRPETIQPLKMTINLPVQHVRGDHGPWSEWREETCRDMDISEWTRHCSGCDELTANRDLHPRFETGKSYCPKCDELDRHGRLTPKERKELEKQLETGKRW